MSRTPSRENTPAINWLRPACAPWSINNFKTTRFAPYAMQNTARNVAISGHFSRTLLNVTSRFKKYEEASPTAYPATLLENGPQPNAYIRKKMTA